MLKGLFSSKNRIKRRWTEKEINGAYAKARQSIDKIQQDLTDAIRRGDIETANTILELHNKICRSFDFSHELLLNAVKDQRWHVVEAFEKAGIDATFYAIFKIDREAFDVLVERGVDVFNYNALILAVELGDIAFVGTLLGEGVDVNGLVNGNSALMIAAKKNDQDMVLYLLERKADVQLKNESGMTALDVARQAGSKDAERIIESFIQGKTLDTAIRACETPALMDF